MIPDKTFLTFFTTKQTGLGTGLVLSLSYDIMIKIHGGELNVEKSISTEQAGNKVEGNNVYYYTSANYCRKRLQQF